MKTLYIALWLRIHKHVLAWAGVTDWMVWQGRVYMETKQKNPYWTGNYYMKFGVFKKYLANRLNGEEVCNV